MRQQTFPSIQDFASKIYETHQILSNDNDIAIILKYDELQKIIPELILLKYKLVSAEIDYPELYGYDDEYIISLFRNEIWCEKMKRNAEYINDESSITYVFDNCSSACLKHLDGDIVYEVRIENMDISEKKKENTECTCNEDDYNSEYISIDRDKNGKPEGIRKSWESTHDGITKYESYSYHSNNTKILEEVASILGIKL